MDGKTRREIKDAHHKMTLPHDPGNDCMGTAASSAMSRWLHLSMKHIPDLLADSERAERYQKALEVIADCQIIPGCIDCRQEARDAMKEPTP